MYNLKNKMIKKLKIGLLVVALAFFVGFGFASSANAVDLTWTADTTVTIDSANYTIESGSAATSIEIGATVLTVVVPSGSTFTFSSSDRYVLSNSASIISDCTSTENSLTIIGPVTVNITPNKNATCTTLGSHGGGGRTPPPVVPPVTPTEGCSAGNLYNTNTGAACINNSYPQGCSGGNLFNTSTGNACVNNQTLQIPGCGNRNTGFSVSTGGSCVGNHITTLTTATYDFGTVTLKNGSRGAAVMELQRFLNAKLGLGLVVDGKLGFKTIAVIKAWQKANGLVADGLVGKLTKIKMHSME